MKRVKINAPKGMTFCFSKTYSGKWFKQGLVPDAERNEFASYYISERFSYGVAFIPYCYQNENIFDENELRSAAAQIF